MRSHRMRGYGAWCQGWRDGERMPNGPHRPPGILFWGFIILVLFSCAMTAIQGSPLAILIGLAVLAGALKAA